MKYFKECEIDESRAALVEGAGVGGGLWFQAPPTPCPGGTRPERPRSSGNKA